MSILKPYVFYGHMSLTYANILRERSDVEKIVNLLFEEGQLNSYSIQNELRMNHATTLSLLSWLQREGAIEVAKEKVWRTRKISKYYRITSEMYFSLLALNNPFMGDQTRPTNLLKQKTEEQIQYDLTRKIPYLYPRNIVWADNKLGLENILKLRPYLLPYLSREQPVLVDKLHAQELFRCLFMLADREVLNFDTENQSKPFFLAILFPELTLIPDVRVAFLQTESMLRKFDWLINHKSALILIRNQIVKYLSVRKDIYEKIKSDLELASAELSKITNDVYTVSHNFSELKPSMGL